MGLRDAALPLKEQALADRIVRGVALALAEDRLIRTGQAAEAYRINEESGALERVL